VRWQLRQMDIILLGFPERPSGWVNLLGRLNALS
jgi:hypothetical protein